MQKKVAVKWQMRSNMTYPAQVNVYIRLGV